MLSERTAPETKAFFLKDSDWDYKRLLNILLRRKFWFTGVFITTLLLTILITLRTKPSYLSSLQVLVEQNYKARLQNNENVTTATELSDPQVQVDSNTQLKILQSTELLQKAYDRLSVLYPTLTLEQLRAGLQISPLYGSDANNKKVRTNLLQIDYIDDDPLKTQKVLQTLLPIYQAYNLEQQKIRLARGLAFINEQLPIVRRSVLEAEAALQQFRRGNQIIDPREQSKTAAATLDSIRQQREALKADIQQAAAQFRSSQQQLELTPKGAIASAQLSQSPLYQARLQAIQKTSLELERQRQQFTDEHPVIQALIKQQQEEQQSLQKEASQVLGTNTSVPRSSQSLISSAQLGDNGVALAKQLTDAQNILTSLQAKDQSLAQTEQQLNQELQKYPALIAQYERLQPEVDVRRSTLQKLLDAKQDLSLEIARGGYNWEVVEAPQEGLQVNPNLVRNLLLGIVVGLFLGAMSAFFRDSLDDTIRSAEQFGEKVPIPLLGVLPWLSHALPESARGEFSANGAPPSHALEHFELFQWGPLREALDLIYGNIQFRSAQPAKRVIMVTSALAGEGKSTLSLGLALSAARRDQKVLLIDADLRHSTLHHRLDLSNDEGLSTLLTANSSNEDVKMMPQWVYMRWDEDEPQTVVPGQTRAIPPSDINMDILTAGPVYGDPVKLLQYDRMKEILDSFRDEYDLIIVDSPPVLGIVDALQIGFSCDGIVMIARAEKVTHSDFTTALANLSQCNVIGCVVNGINTPMRHYGRLSPYTQKEPSVIGARRPVF